MKLLLTSLRLAFVTILICCVGYPLFLLGIAEVVAPGTAEGSLLRGPDGAVVGSRQIAQSFAEPGYFWPRPSAVAYDGAGAGGSNVSPRNPAIAERARKLMSRYASSPEHLIPADLVTASGSGLDPHISLEAAEYQIPRVAKTRQLPESIVRSEVERLAFPVAGSFAPERIVNALELNLALDRMPPQS